MQPNESRKSDGHGRGRAQYNRVCGLSVRRNAAVLLSSSSPSWRSIVFECVVCAHTLGALTRAVQCLPTAAAAAVDAFVAIRNRMPVAHKDHAATAIDIDMCADGGVVASRMISIARRRSEQPKRKSRCRSRHHDMLRTRGGNGSDAKRLRAQFQLTPTVVGGRSI